MIRWLGVLFFLLTCVCEAKAPDLSPEDVTSKAKEIMKSHASQKKLTPVIAQRVLNNYLDNEDPNKTYFIESDIDKWLNSSDELRDQLIKDFDNHQFTIFEDIDKVLISAIKRRRKLEESIDYNDLPSHVKSHEFKDLPWAKNEKELIERFKKIRALQLETASKLSEETKEKSLQRIAKRQARYEGEVMDSNPAERKRFILSNVLKAIASSLDTHTMYFTPEEASQFMINVQQR